MAKRLVIFLLVLNSGFRFAQAQSWTESLDYWTFGVNKPEIQCGLRGDGTTGNYHHLFVGTSAYYYEVMAEGSGTIDFWVYDPFKCQSVENFGYGSNGMAWGLQNPIYQAICVGDFRQSYVAGCLGYSPWSTVSPYFPLWFKDGIRGANNVPWQAGWYKWRVNGQMDNITFTICNITYCITDGPPDDDLTIGDCAQVYDATTFSGQWAAVFGYGWKAFWLRGDAATGIEDPYIDVTSGDGIFMECCPAISLSRTNTDMDGCSPVSQYYKQSTWGNIKALHR